MGPGGGVAPVHRGRPQPVAIRGHHLDLEHVDVHATRRDDTVFREAQRIAGAGAEAAIVGDGLLGGKYVNLVPGQAAEKVKAGGVLARTRDYQSLEDLVGQIIFLATSNGDQKQSDAPK